MNWPKVGIVLINFNGLEHTMECVDSLSKITYPNHQVYVVDNRSDESPKESIHKVHPSIRVVENEWNLGFTGGNLSGTLIAFEEGADLILLLNNDTTVAPDFLEPLVTSLTNNPELGMVTPKIYFYGQEKVIWAYGGKVSRLTGRSPHIGVYKKDEGQYDHIHEVDRITGCAMLVRKEVFDKVGSMDDRFFMYCEETDWCLRTRKAGYRLAVIPSSIIWHKGHRASGRVGRPFIGYLLARNQLLSLRKNARSFFARGFFALLWYFTSITVNSIKFFLRGIFRIDPQGRAYAKALILGMIDYWRGRWGAPPWVKNTSAQK